MKLSDIIELTDASKATIYRWIAQRGFPRSEDGVWRRPLVAAWWRDNKHKVGRHPNDRL